MAKIISCAGYTAVTAGTRQRRGLGSPSPASSGGAGPVGGKVECKGSPYFLTGVAYLPPEHLKRLHH